MKWLKSNYSIVWWLMILVLMILTVFWYDDGIIDIILIKRWYWRKYLMMIIIEMRRKMKCIYVCNTALRNLRLFPPVFVDYSRRYTRLRCGVPIPTIRLWHCRWPLPAHTVTVVIATLTRWLLRCCGDPVTLHWTDCTFCWLTIAVI